MNFSVADGVDVGKLSTASFAWGSLPSNIISWVVKAEQVAYGLVVLRSARLCFFISKSAEFFRLLRQEYIWPCCSFQYSFGQCECRPTTLVLAPKPNTCFPATFVVISCIFRLDLWVAPILLASWTVLLKADRRDVHELPILNLNVLSHGKLKKRCCCLKAL